MWGLFNFLLKIVQPASSRKPRAKVPSPQLSGLEKEAIGYHVEAMNYLRQARYEKAAEKALKARDIWKQLRRLAQQGGYGGHLTEKLAGERIRTLTTLHARSQECETLSRSILSSLNTETFLEQHLLQEKTDCSPKELTYLLDELEMAGLIEKYEEESGKLLWRKQPNH